MPETPDPPEPDLLALADELYGLPLAEFTPARDRRAKELKGTPAAAPVKALRKPSLAAWVVNLLVRREAEQVEQVLSMGAALREAQAAMSGDQLRELTRQRRQLTAVVTQQARSLAAEAGVKVTQSVAEQVEATLTAAMVEEACAQAVRSGLLVGALSATGVDEVDVAAAVALPEALGFTATPREAAPSRPPELHVVPDPEAEETARAAARDAVALAEQEVEDARAAHEEAATEAGSSRRGRCSCRPRPTSWAQDRRPRDRRRGARASSPTPRTSAPRPSRPCVPPSRPVTAPAPPSTGWGERRRVCSP